MKKLIILLLILSVSIGCNSSKETSNKNKTETVMLSGKYTIATMSNKDVASKAMTLTFDTETNGVSGKATCNSFFGSYSQTGNELDFSRLGSTKMYCDDMSHEIDLFDALKKTTSFVINDTEVSLLNNDEALLTLIKQ